MGLASIDPHSQKERTEIHKIPKFSVDRASFYSYGGTSYLKLAINLQICRELSTKRHPKMTRYS